MNGWKKVERSGEMDFRLMLKSRRLAGMFADVWQSLTVEDRNQISNRLTVVSDHSVLRYILTGGDEIVNGAAVPIHSGGCFVFLNALELRKEPDEFVRYVIAHELAHAYHNHTGRFELDRKTKEAQADRRAKLWGFPAPKLTIKTGVKFPAGGMA